MNHFKIWKQRLQKFIDNPYAISPFLKKRLYYNHIADRYIDYYADFKYLNYSETLQEIIYKQKSVVRFGDELFDMLQGIGLYYGDWRQKYDPELSKRLKDIISSRNPNLLICFNPEFILKTKSEFKEAGILDQYQFWTNSKIFLKDYYHPDIVYGSALCFHPRYNKEINFRELKNFFSTKHIYIVTSNITRFQHVKLGTTTTLLEIPASDAWERYDYVKRQLLSLLNTSPDKSKILVLVSMASAAKVLVYDLVNLGYTAWDTGQFFDLAYQEIEKLQP
jgi:hypothetical protein